MHISSIFTKQTIKDTKLIVFTDRTIHESDQIVRNSVASHINIFKANLFEENVKAISIEVSKSEAQS
jgi:hypothetical protein